MPSCSNIDNTTKEIKVTHTRIGYNLYWSKKMVGKFRNFKVLEKGKAGKDFIAHPISDKLIVIGYYIMGKGSFLLEFENRKIKVVLVNKEIFIDNISILSKN